MTEMIRREVSGREGSPGRMLASPSRREANGGEINSAIRRAMAHNTGTRDYNRALSNLRALQGGGAQNLPKTIVSKSEPKKSSLTPRPKEPPSSRVPDSPIGRFLSTCPGSTDIFFEEGEGRRINFPPDTPSVPEMTRVGSRYVSPLAVSPKNLKGGKASQLKEKADDAVNEQINLMLGEGTVPERKPRNRVIKDQNMYRHTSLDGHDNDPTGRKINPTTYFGKRANIKGGAYERMRRDTSTAHNTPGFNNNSVYFFSDNVFRKFICICPMLMSRFFLKTLSLKK